MGYFKKYFIDGEEEFGPDELSTTSWSRGRLKEITEVHISDDKSEARLVLPNTEWHFFDRYHVSLEKDDSERAYRVLQARIKEEHVGFPIQYGGSETFLLAQYVENPADTIRYPSVVIEEKHIGKYATVVLDRKKIPYFLIAERGRYAN